MEVLRPGAKDGKTWVDRPDLKWRLPWSAEWKSQAPNHYQARSLSPSLFFRLFPSSSRVWSPFRLVGGCTERQEAAIGTGPAAAASQAGGRGRKEVTAPSARYWPAPAVALWAAARACTEVDILYNRQRKKRKSKGRIYAAAMLPFMRETMPRVVGCHWAGLFPFPRPQGPGG